MISSPDRTKTRKLRSTSLSNYSEKRSPRTLRAGLSILLSVGLLLGVATGSAEEAPLKVLTIGNSFADNATTFLPQLAQAGGHPFLLCRANLGGAPFARHVAGIKAFEANPEDPAGRPYKWDFIPQRANDGKKLSLRTILELEKWEYVTIQQVSNESFKPETYEPYAGTLIEYVKKYAPQAVILVHQTWAYREDYPGFTNGFTQEKMYEGLTSAYRGLAEKYKLKIMPVGLAFQSARKTDLWHFQYPDPKFDYDNVSEKSIPDQKGSLNMGWGWSKDPATGKQMFRLDFKHANTAGKYLGGAVWYEVLFGKNVEENSFVPPGLDAKTAGELRKVAHEAVAQFQQVPASQTAAK